jgi:hypothetical protein
MTKRWIWYFIKNLLLAGLLMVAGFATSFAVSLLLVILGIVLIFTGLSAVGTYFFVNDSGNVEYMGCGTQAFACAMFAVPGYLLIKFADRIVHSFEWFVILTGLFFVVVGIWRARACNAEAYEVYVGKSASILSWVYPFAMIGGGAALGLSYLYPSLESLASLLLIVSPILWMVRAVLVYQDNK